MRGFNGGEEKEREGEKLDGRKSEEVGMMECKKGRKRRIFLKFN